MNSQLDSDRAQRAWVNDYTVRYGVPPMAGGETPQVDPAAPPAAPAAPAAPQAQPQAPAAQPAAPQAPFPGQQVPAAQPQQPSVLPGQPQPQAQPQAPVQPGQAPSQPVAPLQGDQVQELIRRMDAIQAHVAPQQVDPLAVEMGLVPAPPQAPQGVPQQFAQQPGYPPQPQGYGGSPQFDPNFSQQGPAQPGQLQEPGGPGPRSDAEIVQAYIAEEAQRQATAALQPYIQQQEASRRREEAMGLREDYPELNNPQVAQEAMARARHYAQALGYPQIAGEPGFVELVHLVQRGIAATGQAQPPVPGAQPGAVPQQPGAVTLETPGGTPPPAPANNESAQRILAAGRRGQLSPLWGGTAQAAAPLPVPTG